jgi:hypothetical protein
MTHPEINLSWVGFFLRPKWDADTCTKRKYGVNAENADFCFFISEISVLLRPN